MDLLIFKDSVRVKKTCLKSMNRTYYKRPMTFDRWPRKRVSLPGVFFKETLLYFTVICCGPEVAREALQNDK